jgi:hypothetical protein
MEWDINNSTWRFSQRRRNGTEWFGISLPDFCQTFQQHIDDGTIVPGWHGGGGGEYPHSWFHMPCLCFYLKVLSSSRIPYKGSLQ